MNVYISESSIFCPDCAPDSAIGPYPDGGGKSDCPRHCDECECYLDAPLTDDGVHYVIDALEEYLWTGRGQVEILRVWAGAIRQHRLDDDGEKTLYAFDAVRRFLDRAERKRP